LDFVTFSFIIFSFWLNVQVIARGLVF